MSRTAPHRMAFHSVSEAARRQGYSLIVTNGRTWLIKGLSWRCLRTEDVAAFLCPSVEKEDAPKHEPTHITGFQPSNNDSHEETL